MDLNKTIFILGAGASIPYNFPTARQLREDIIDKSTEILSHIYNQSPDINISLSEMIQVYRPIIEQFKRSNTESIDLFLTRNRESIDVELGIKLICFFILWYENKSKVIDRNQNWYFEFFNELTKNITNVKELNSLVTEPILFVTFNYDRSLENFLFDSLQNSFSLNNDDAKSIYKKLFYVYHVYGKVGNLPWEDSTSSIEFRGLDSIRINSTFFKQIKLIYDERDKIPDTIQTMIQQSTRVFILGFAFAEPNIEVLNIRNLLGKYQQVYATGIGLFDSRINQVKKALMRGIVGIPDFKIRIEQNQNNLQLLQSFLF